MKLKTLSIFEFDEFSKKHPLGTYHQSSNYGILMSENKYDYELIGMVDEDNNILAASLILIKKIGLFERYGYAPKGFLIDYSNTELLEQFCKLLKKRYYRKNFVFIKINPEIAIGTINNKNEVEYNDNKNLIPIFERIGFKKLKDNKLFESLIPKYNVILNMKDYNISKNDKRTRNKIRKSSNKGLSLIKGDRTDIESIYRFIKFKKNSSIIHYYNYYNVFSRDDSLDIFLVKIDFEKALIATRKNHEKELERNNLLVSKFIDNNTEENLKRKMDSDHILETYNNEIANLTKYLAKQKEEIIAGAITIKYKNRVNIIISGFDIKYKALNPNYFLHHQLIEYYKNDYDYIDLNGITGDFSKENPYKGLNEFKLGFNPTAVELIGELDLIINSTMYKNLDINGFLKKEFDRSKINKPVDESKTNKVKELKSISKEKKQKKSFITISK